MDAGTLARGSYVSGQDPGTLTRGSYVSGHGTREREPTDARFNVVPAAKKDLDQLEALSPTNRIVDRVMQKAVVS